MSRTWGWGDTMGVFACIGFIVAVSVAGATESERQETEKRAALLSELTVEPERSTEGYDRELFPHWRSIGGGCDVRDLVLERASRVSVGCTGPGDWVSPYDGLRTTERAEIEVDHLVALAEAWRSGAHVWNDEQREGFANDLANLTAVTAQSNQAKSDDDPGDRWQPIESYRCRYADRWVAVKLKWSLTVDRDELNALRETLEDC